MAYSLLWSLICVDIGETVQYTLIRNSAILDCIIVITSQLQNEQRWETQGQEAILLQDGWSDIHNTYVIASSLHVKEKSYFLSAVETGTNQRSAAYSESIAKESITDAFHKFGCTVTSVVTDKVNKMKAMRKSLKDANPD